MKLKKVSLNMQRFIFKVKMINTKKVKENEKNCFFSFLLIFLTINNVTKHFEVLMERKYNA